MKVRELGTSQVSMQEQQQGTNVQSEIFRRIEFSNISETAPVSEYFTFENLSLYRLCIFTSDYMYMLETAINTREPSGQVPSNRVVLPNCHCVVVVGIFVLMWQESSSFSIDASRLYAHMWRPGMQQSRYRVSIASAVHEVHITTVRLILFKTSTNQVWRVDFSDRRWLCENLT